MRRLVFWRVPKDADVKPHKSLWWPWLMTLRTGACVMWLAWYMERVWSMVGLWLCCGRYHIVLVGNDNDRNAGFFGGSGVEEVFQWSSDISPTRVASDNGGTEQWWGGHHQRLRQSRPLIVLQKERDRAWTMIWRNNILYEGWWRALKWNEMQALIEVSNIIQWGRWTRWKRDVLEWRWG